MGLCRKLVGREIREKKKYYHKDDGWGDVFPRKASCAAPGQGVVQRHWQQLVLTSLQAFAPI